MVARGGGDGVEAGFGGLRGGEGEVSSWKLGRHGRGLTIVDGLFEQICKYIERYIR